MSTTIIKMEDDTAAAPVASTEEEVVTQDELLVHDPEVQVNDDNNDNHDNQQHHASDPEDDDDATSLDQDQDPLIPTGNPTTPTSSSRRLSSSAANTTNRNGLLIFDKTLLDVVITPSPINPVDSSRSNKKFSKLKSIAHHAIPIIKLDDMRAFCSKNKIKGVRRFRKDEISEAIVFAKEQFDLGVGPPYWCPEAPPPLRKSRLDNNSTINSNDGVVDASVMQELIQVDNATNHVHEDGNIAAAIGAGAVGVGIGAGVGVVNTMNAGMGAAGIAGVTGLSSGKKRSRDDGVNEANLPSMALGSEISIPNFNEGLLPRTHNESLHGNSRYMHLQKVIAYSIKEKNSSVALKELVDAASRTLKDVREEKAVRKEMFKEFMESLDGDDKAGREHIRNAKRRKLENNNNEDSTKENDSDLSEEAKEMIEGIVKQDALIERLTSQHGLLSHKVSQILQSF